MANNYGFTLYGICGNTHGFRRGSVFNTAAAHQHSVRIYTVRRTGYKRAIVPVLFNAKCIGILRQHDQYPIHLISKHLIKRSSSLNNFALGSPR